MALFAASEQGVWYDPSDFSTLFQNSSGTTPVTAVEQPVGLILDKSKSLALGSQLVTDGSFSVGTVPAGWSAAGSATLGITSGELVITTSVGSGFPGGNLALTTVVGTWYRVRLTARATTSNPSTVYIGDAGGNYITGTANMGATNTSYDIYFLARYTSTTVKIFEFIGGAGTGTIIVDNVSATSVSGNHASQATSGSRPVLRARYNLLTYSEQFDNAAWVKGFATVSANVVSAPDGTTTADKLVETATTASHYLVQTSTGNTVGTTFSIYAKAAGRSILGVGFSYPADCGVYIDVSDGSFVNNLGTAPTSYTVTDSGDGWYKISVTNAGANVNNAWVLLSDGSPSTNRDSYAGDITKGIYLWGADLRVTNDGVGLPAYQRIAAATDYDTTGFPPYLLFDGTDDSMATAAIDFSATDEMSVFAGVRVIGSSAAQFFAELSASISSVNGAFNMVVPGASPFSGRGFRSKGTVQGTADTANDAYTAPITQVLSGLGDISEDSTVLRVNGVQAASSAGDQGTGNFGNHALYIGSRAGTGSYFNGRLYSLIVRGKTSTADEITAAETWVNSKTGAY